MAIEDSKSVLNVRGMVHDCRTVLHGMMGWAQVAEYRLMAKGLDHSNPIVQGFKDVTLMVKQLDAQLVELVSLVDKDTRTDDPRLMDSRRSLQEGVTGIIEHVGQLRVHAQDHCAYPVFHEIAGLFDKLSGGGREFITLVMFLGQGSIHDMVEVVAIHRILDEIISDYEYNALPGYTFERSFSDRSALIEAHPALLKTLFRNLINNSLEAMPQGGCISLSSQMVLACESTCDGNGGVQVLLRDEGVGMTPEQCSRMVQPGQTSKRHEDGLHGLGLSNVKHYLASIGASMCVDSEPFKGTTIRMCFPRQTVRSQVPFDSCSSMS